ncbi:hypothetical protein KFE25_014277 [Diacronema lutheri]|uniref:Uncharacterized protein n=3 Tax=Diacronema lutheri TaxID=2081491 RepID=A0A8J6C2T6_DIALT|nr:hypothetical protein KFE25_014277 [Diacronema lutheri]
MGPPVGSQRTLCGLLLVTAASCAPLRGGVARGLAGGARAYLPPARLQAGASREPALAPARADRRPPAELRDYVLGIVEHDLKELGFALLAECSRCASAVRRVASDEAERALRGEGGGDDDDDASSTARADLDLDDAEPAGDGRWARLRFWRRQNAVHARAPASPGVAPAPAGTVEAVVAGAGSPRVVRRIARICDARRVRLALLLDAYVHWRLPLALWWVVRSASDTLAPLQPALAPLAPSLAPIAASAARQLRELGWRRAGGPEARAELPWAAAPSSTAPLAHRRAQPSAGSPAPAPAREDAAGLPGALLHLSPQIVAKARHAVAHEPAALGTFAAVALKLALLVPLLRIALLLGAPAAGARRRLLRAVLREAMRFSERCNRVELRASLLHPPPALTRGTPRRLFARYDLHAAAAALAARSARALEELARARRAP